MSTTYLPKKKNYQLLTIVFTLAFVILGYFVLEPQGITIINDQPASEEEELTLDGLIKQNDKLLDEEPETSDDLTIMGEVTTINLALQEVVDNGEEVTQEFVDEASALLTRVKEGEFADLAKWDTFLDTLQSFVDKWPDTGISMPLEEDW